MNIIAKEIQENIEALISAFNYNMDTAELIECLKTVCDRLNGNPFVPHNNIAIDLIISFIVLRYGDYGTSPRYGWFPKFERRVICTTIAARISELEEILKEEERDDYH